MCRYQYIRRSSLNRSVQGFSLIELMSVAVLVTLFFSTITAMVLSISRVTTSVQQTGEITESAQYLTSILKRELDLAGFYGELDLISQHANRPYLCANASEMTIDEALMHPVDGINNMPVDQRLCDQDAVLAETDILLLRRGLLLSQNKPEQVTDWKQTLYYVSVDKSFKRRRYIHGSYKRPEPVIEGVEDFQVEYGIRSVSQQGIKTKFVELPSSEQEWNQLVAIRFFLLLSSSAVSATDYAPRTYQYAKKSIEILDDKQYGLFTSMMRLNNLTPKVVEFDLEI